MLTYRWGGVVVELQRLVFMMSMLFAVIVLIDILPPRGVKQLTVHELRNMLKKQSKEDIQYVDIRKPSRFYRLHVFGFINIPMDDLKKELAALNKNQQIVVISERGYGGNKACKLLKRKGFIRVMNVRGGVVSWETFQSGSNMNHF